MMGATNNDQAGEAAKSNGKAGVAVDIGETPVRYLDLPRPAPGEMRLSAPGVWWMRFPLPFRLNHVNIWVLEDDDDAVTVVDSGICDAATKALWESVLAGPLAGKRVTRVIATHYHPDHIGLCGWLVERTGAAFAAGMADWLLARVLSKPPSDAASAASRLFYQRAGADEALVDYVMGRGGAYRSLVGSAPPALQRLRVGGRLAIGGREWRVVNTAGHTPEPASLFCPELNLLISGDQVLPRISPNISVTPYEPDGDPLADFLATFDDLRALPADVAVFPSHDQPFVGLHERLDALEGHHRERLDEVRSLCAQPRTARELAEETFSPGLDLHQQMFALGEVLAHLNHLLGQGRVSRRLGDDGAWRYRAKLTAGPAAI